MKIEIYDDAETHEGVDFVIDHENGLMTTHVLCEHEAIELQDQLTEKIGEATEKDSVHIHLANSSDVYTTVVMTVECASGVLEILKNKLAGHWKNEGSCYHDE